ncbi:homogentisate phytyltransferase 1, chloroplastic-like [Bidens hawaiensis]|uniref:homogentisate phytyltransferase 1, chloroplastic-like n=1 Tax=Bidens hawaiensis TaxID=980011 RepID=UPI00404ADDC2
MTSLTMGSLCKPTSLLFAGVVKSPSSLTIGSQPSKFLRISNADMNESLTFQRRNTNNHTDKTFYERFTPHLMKNEKFKLNATSSNNHQFDATHDLTNPMEKAIRFVDVLYRFIRPYAAIGTVLSVLAMSLLNVQKLSDFSPLFFLKMIQTLVGGMFMQMYVCGFNQICDIELDKVNKPSLPLAAGELSMTTAIVVSSLSAIMSLLTAWLAGSPPLFWGFVGWFVVGTAYSANVLPWLRWKRFPFTAAFYMLMARALVVPIGYYMHMQNSISGGSSLLSRPILFAVGMLSAFSVSTIFFKDIPDIEGDRMHGIKSLAIKLGEKRMYWICIWILEIAYIAAALVGATSPIAWSKYVTIISHLAMGTILWIRAKSVNLKNMEAVQSMYMFLWQVNFITICMSYILLYIV